MNFYADTSFLVSLYVADSHSAAADRWRREHPEPLPFTNFHRVEFRNALSLAVFQKRLTQSQVDAVWNDIETDWQDGSLVTPPLDWSAVLLRADDLAKNHTPIVGSRTLDVIHIAAASVLGLGLLLSFDDRQNALAKMAGLSVVTVSP